MGVVRDVSVTLSVDERRCARPSTARPPPIVGMVVGRVTGALRFSDSQGASSTCPAIQWSMQPY